MSLGVLNNLNAMYAENNLNNTSNSLSNVLNQLTSGSKINSGADDAAGLSLVNGLQANSVALSQSKTNAQEGVGLLTVADGALSQVTNLLNRAVTLATEASNGTLNASQDTAANQEYQSILSEISNIGSTTTYNNQTVFGVTKDIYTGDSSTQGASINSLNIRSLSSSNVGDSGGVMAYSNGQGNVFINLSSSSKNAQSTDTLNSGPGGSTINVNYLVKGANGSENTATSSITVGGTSGYANTADGLISAINNAGLGLTASFTTQSQAGVVGGGTQTGIQITGGLISAGVDPNVASTSGELNPTGIPANELLTQGQVVTVQVGGTTAAAITIDSTTSTLQNLADAINKSTANGGSGSPSTLVKASVVTNGDGSQSLSLAGAAGAGALTVTATGGANGPKAINAAASLGEPVNFTLGTPQAGHTGSDGTAKLALSSGTNSATDVLTGSITLQNGSGTAVTFAAGTGSTAGVVYLGSTGDNSSTLGNLATALAANSTLGVNATVDSTGITITSKSVGTALSAVGTPSLTAAPALASLTNVAGAPASSGTPGTATVTLNGDGNNYATDGSTAITGSLTVTNGNQGSPGTAVTYHVGLNGAGNTTGTSTDVYLGSGAKTMSDMMAAIATITSNAITGSRSEER